MNFSTRTLNPEPLNPEPNVTSTTSKNRLLFILQEKVDVYTARRSARRQKQVNDDPNRQGDGGDPGRRLLCPAAAGHFHCPIFVSAVPGMIQPETASPGR